MASEPPRVPPAAGLCAGCRHARALGTSRGSVFVQCGRAREMPALPLYPRLPVIACIGYEAASSLRPHPGAGIE